MSYKDRLKTEIKDLSSKLNLLDAFMRSEGFKELQLHERTLLEAQFYAMMSYAACLNGRASS